MWQIFGIWKWRAPGMDDDDVIIATFDTEKMAKDYLSSAKLKNPNHMSKFKRKSLLSGYDQAWVEEYDPPAYTHNPKINF